METQSVKNLRQLSENVGKFIRYWGFRNIHGEIWAQVYLSAKPLSGAELVKKLKVSKALVSPAIKQLIKEGLIQEIKGENSKTKRYIANENVGDVIRKVLSRRESSMIELVNISIKRLKESGQAGLQIDPGRMQSLEKMVHQAQGMLAMLINTRDIWD